MISEFSYVRPRTLKEAMGHLAAPGARLHAGGTDLLGCLRDNVFTAERVVSISRLKGLGEIKETADGGVLIGALVSLTAITDSPFLRRLYPALIQGARGAASPQLRNQGTLGGNLCQKPRCWYYRGEFHCARKGGDRCYAFGGENRYHCILGGSGCYIVHPSDTAPALVAYGAICEIAGPKGTRRVAVEKFHVPPSQGITRETVLARDEIVTHISIPPPAAGLRSSYRKVRARGAWDFALAGVALALRLSGRSVLDARIVLSGAAPIPWRCPEAEKLLSGRILNAENAGRAAEAALNGARPLEQNEYKVQLFRGLIAEELERAGRDVIA